MPSGWKTDLGAELARQHLRAEADAEKRLLLLERHLQPVGLALDEIVVSLALIGPPKIAAPACSASVSGSGSPSAGRRMSSWSPRAADAEPIRPGVDIS